MKTAKVQKLCVKYYSFSRGIDLEHEKRETGKREVGNFNVSLNCGFISRLSPTSYRL